MSKKDAITIARVVLFSALAIITTVCLIVFASAYNNIVENIEDSETEFTEITNITEYTRVTDITFTHKFTTATYTLPNKTLITYTTSTTAENDFIGATLPTTDFTTNTTTNSTTISTTISTKEITTTSTQTTVSTTNTTTSAATTNTTTTFPETTTTIEITTQATEDDNKGSLIGNFRGTYYCYGKTNVTGGSGRTLIDCSVGDGTVKGSIASWSLYSMLGYNRDGRTKVYIESGSCPALNGYYYLDDSTAAWVGNTIDFYYDYQSNCQFQYIGILTDLKVYS